MKLKTIMLSLCMTYCLLLGCAQGPAPLPYQPYPYDDKAREALGLVEDVGGSVNNYTLNATPSRTADVLLGIDAYAGSWAVNRFDIEDLLALAVSTDLDGSVSTTEFGYINTLASNAQTQITAAEEITADESSDASLATLGQLHVRGDEDRVSFHVGAGGEIAGEVTKSLLSMVSFSVDPGSWYDSDAELFLFEVDSEVFPNGIIIDEWGCSCNVDPDTEIDADLRYADAWIGLANAADIDEIDTTSGTSSEDTDANINAGNAVAAGKIIYIGFDADPEGTCVQMHFKMKFHAEED